MKIYLRESCKMPDKLNFNKEELSALYKLTKEYYEELPDDMDDWYNSHYDFDEEPIEKEILISILKKISGMLPDKEKELIDKDFLRKKYHTFNNEINEKAYNIIEKAFDQSKTVEIDYFSMGSAEFKKRKIDVYYKSRKYVIGYCHLRKEIRKFRTSRIGLAKLTKNKYKIPDNFDKNKY